MSKKMLLNFIIVISTGLLLSCGGSKETVNFEPDPFPEPPVSTRPTPEPPKPEPTPEPDIPKVAPLRLSTVYFDFDASSLTPQAKAVLAENARQLENHPDAIIRIEGHCDERGTVEYNLALGQRRALATRDYLVSFGILPGRVSIISYGKERPVDHGHSSDAWSKNRRSEFIILN